jgi:hypothetical protein
MSNKNTAAPAASLTARNLEEGLRSRTSAQPEPQPQTSRPVGRLTPTTERYTEVVAAEPYEPPVRLFAKKKTAPTVTPTVAKPPVVNEPVLLFNIAYEVLRNAKDTRDANTPDLAYELYTLDITDRRERWTETKVALIAFIKANKQYILSLDSKTRWVQQFGQTL